MNTGSTSRAWSSKAFSSGVMKERPTIRHSFLGSGGEAGDTGMPASCCSACDAAAVDAAAVDAEVPASCCDESGTAGNGGICGVWPGVATVATDLGIG